MDKEGDKSTNATTTIPKDNGNNDDDISSNKS